MIHQCNESARHFKDALGNFAIKGNFNFHLIKNDKERVMVICAVDGCQWHVHVLQEGNLTMFKIKTSHKLKHHMIHIHGWWCWYNITPESLYNKEMG